MAGGRWGVHNGSADGEAILPVNVWKSWQAWTSSPCGALYWDVPHTRASCLGDFSPKQVRAIPRGVRFIDEVRFDRDEKMLMLRFRDDRTASGAFGRYRQNAGGHWSLKNEAAGPAKPNKDHDVVAVLLRTFGHLQC